MKKKLYMILLLYIIYIVYYNFNIIFVKPEKNSNFMKNGKMVISVKIWNFSKFRMIKKTSPLESYREI